MKITATALVLACIALQPRLHDAPPQPSNSSEAQQQSATNGNGTESKTLIALAFPSQQANPETPNKQQQNKQGSADANWWMVGLTSVYCLAAILQLIVFGIQAKRLRETISKMDEIAGQEMRAYVTVNVGFALYQDRPNNAKFQSMPAIVNSGRTPAYKLGFSMRAEILPVPLPDGFSFPPIPKRKSEESESILGPQQTITLWDGGVVDDFVPDQDVDGIKSMIGGRCLYVWGFVTYEDIFKRPHKTEFCQSIVWLPNGNVYGFFTAGRNKAS